MGANRIVIKYFDDYSECTQEIKTFWVAEDIQAPNENQFKLYHDFYNIVRDLLEYHKNAVIISVTKEHKEDVWTPDKQ